MHVVLISNITGLHIQANFINTVSFQYGLEVDICLSLSGNQNLEVASGNCGDVAPTNRARRGKCRAVYVRFTERVNLQSSLVLILFRFAFSPRDLQFCI